MSVHLFTLMQTQSVSQSERDGTRMRAEPDLRTARTMKTDLVIRGDIYDGQQYSIESSYLLWAGNG
jgi:hypothetical protein